MAKSKMFKTKNEIKKTLQKSIIESVAAAGSGVAASFAYSGLKSKIPEKMKKFGGIGLIGIGTGLNIAAKESVLKAAANGIATAGGVHVVNELGSPKMKQKMGLSLSGLEATEESGADAITDEELKEIEREMSRNLDSEDDDDSDNSNEIKGLEEEEDFDDDDFDDDEF